MTCWMSRQDKRQDISNGSGTGGWQSNSHSVVNTADASTTSEQAQGPSLIIRALQERNGVSGPAAWRRARRAGSQGRPGRVASQAAGSARCCSGAKPQQPAVPEH